MQADMLEELRVTHLDLYRKQAEKLVGASDTSKLI